MKAFAPLFVSILLAAWHPVHGQPTFEERLSKAQAGDVQAQFNLGSAYDSGIGVAANSAEAEKWYRRAAEAGHAEAQNSLGSLLQTRKDYSEAYSWYGRAAAQGHVFGTHNLAYLIDLGLGVTQDRRKAVELYMRAAEQGWAESMWNLANTYGAGLLGQKDLLLACVWTYRARRFARPHEQVLITRTESTLARLERILPGYQMLACKQRGSDWQPNKKPEG